jgi:hypothetical protein
MDNTPKQIETRSAPLTSAQPTLKAARKAQYNDAIQAAQAVVVRLRAMKKAQDPSTFRTALYLDLNNLNYKTQLL